MDRKSLQRLIATARKAPVESPPEATAPYGFANRVAATWCNTRAEGVVLLERLAWRGLVCALLICAGAALSKRFTEANGPVTQGGPAPELADESEFF